MNVEKKRWKCVLDYAIRLENREIPPPPVFLAPNESLPQH